MLPTRILVKVCCCGSDQRIFNFSPLSPNSNFKRRVYSIISVVGMGRWLRSTVPLIITGSNCTFTPGYPAKLIKTGRQWSHILPSQNSWVFGVALGMECRWRVFSVLSRSFWDAAWLLSGCFCKTVMQTLPVPLQVILYINIYFKGCFKVS